MKLRKSAILAAAAALAMSAGALGQDRSPPRDMDCKLKFSLDSWSVIYKHADGAGEVLCEGMPPMPVRIKARGAGLTVGKSHIEHGTGEFTDVRFIEDVLGDYAQAGAHAGAVKSAQAGVLTKGEVSLALAGHGEGFDLGVDVTKFTIKRR